jgi:hypothetical protein
MLNNIVGLLDAGIPASTNSYESISTVTVGSGGTSTITFSSIPSTYKHLQVRMTTNSGGNLRFNGDTTSSNYRYHVLYGSGSAAVASTAANNAYSPADASGSTGWTGEVLDILDYANTSKNKVTRSLGGWDNNGSGLVWLSSNLWMSTAAINQIVFTGTFPQYSSFALYGIKG